MKDYLKENLKIRLKVEELSKKRTFGCVSVREIATILHKDSRTVQTHMQIMENYSHGIFIDNKKTLFCTKDGRKKISKRFT